MLAKFMAQCQTNVQRMSKEYQKKSDDEKEKLTCVQRFANGDGYMPILICVCNIDYGWVPAKYGI